MSCLPPVLHGEIFVGEAEFAEHLRLRHNAMLAEAEGLMVDAINEFLDVRVEVLPGYRHQINDRMIHAAMQAGIARWRAKRGV